MHHPNHAMVNAANSLMSEYGDAMQHAIYNTAPRKVQKALSNPIGELDGKKVVLALGIGALLWHLSRD